MKKYLAAAAVVVGLCTGVSTVASAGPSATPKATGGVGLSGPQQWADFNAFDYGATGDRGSIHYTNFDYAVAGTNVWDVRGTYPLVFGSGQYPHTMTVSSITPTSPTASTFTGSGTYDPDNSYTWTVTGTVDGANLVFDIVYTGTNAGYTVHGVGTIGSDGSIAGTATTSASQVLDFASPAGSVHEVFSYTSTAFSCVVVSGTDARFVFAIPAGVPNAGTNVLVKVHDGGTPGTNGDTWSHGVVSGPNPANCDGGTSAYPIVSGNLVVH